MKCLLKVIIYQSKYLKIKFLDCCKKNGRRYQKGKENKNVFFFFCNSTGDCSFKMQIKLNLSPYSVWKIKEISDRHGHNRQQDRCCPLYDVLYGF